jgi:hypothetical protein
MKELNDLAQEVGSSFTLMVSVKHQVSPGDMRGIWLEFQRDHDGYPVDVQAGSLEAALSAVTGILRSRRES